jgi:hypothetical protein
MLADCISITPLLGAHIGDTAFWESGTSATAPYGCKEATTAGGCRSLIGRSVAPRAPSWLLVRTKPVSTPQAVPAAAVSVAHEEQAREHVVVSEMAASRAEHALQGSRVTLTYSAGTPPRGVSHGTTTVSLRALDRLHALLEQEVVKEVSKSRRDRAGFLIHGAARQGQLECVPKATVSTGPDVEERPGLEGPTYSSSTSSGLHCRGLICCLVTVLLNHMYRKEMSDWYIHGAIHCYNR